MGLENTNDNDDDDDGVERREVGNTGLVREFDKATKSVRYVRKDGTAEMGWISYDEEFDEEWKKMKFMEELEEAQRRQEARRGDDDDGNKSGYSSDRTVHSSEDVGRMEEIRKEMTEKEVEKIRKQHQIEIKK